MSVNKFTLNINNEFSNIFINLVMKNTYFMFFSFSEQPIPGIMALITSLIDNAH